MSHTLRAYPILRRLLLYQKIPYQYTRPSIVSQTSIPIQRHGSSLTRGKLLLSAEGPDGTAESIAEDQLYTFTRNRWICNETLNLSLRYLKFDLHKLLDAAVAASSEGARYCTRVHKCREGLNNKAFILTMDNGSEIFAKLPNPCAGPAFYTTASEVATREFLRDVLNISSPQILAWSADRNNPVGAEYILEERAPGVALGSFWYQWPIQSRLEIIEQIVDMERKLASVKFSKSGCIFFREDVPLDMSAALSLDTSLLFPPAKLERYKLGPLVSSELWHGDRTAFNMNRGPYNEPLEYVKAMGTNEIQYIKTHAHPRMNYHRSLTELEMPNDALTLLERYLQLSPAMVPSKNSIDPEDVLSPTLWHPDLHLDNIFVDPESRQITRIIDWQSAAVMPFFYQCGIARMIRVPWTVSTGLTVPELPANYDTLAVDEQKRLESNRKSEIALKYYRALTFRDNPRHWAALQLQRQNLEVQTQPSRLVTRVWEKGELFFLRKALLQIIGQWGELCPGSGPCPVSFCEQEIKLHEIEEDSFCDAAEILRLFRDNWGLPPDGMVEPSRYEEIHSEIEELKKSFIIGAGEDAEKAARIWPYQDLDINNSI